MKPPAATGAEPTALSSRFGTAPFVAYFQVFLRAQAAEHGVHLSPIWYPDSAEPSLRPGQAQVRGR